MQPKLDIVRLVLTFPFIWFSFFYFRTKFKFAWIQWLAWFSLTLFILMYHVLRDMLWLASSKRFGM
jgi:hypothetical protein